MEENCYEFTNQCTKPTRLPGSYWMMNSPMYCTLKMLDVGGNELEPKHLTITVTFAADDD